MVVRRLLTSSAKERLRKFARVALGLDVRFARSRRFDLWRYEMDVKYTRRLFHFEHLLRSVEPVDGRIVECGVGPGRSLLAFSVISQYLMRCRDIYGFDTFEGIPPPGPQDGAANSEKSGWWNYSREYVRELLKYNGLDQSEISQRITLIPGDFDRTLVGYDGGSIALLHLDVDFYASYKIALESLYQYVSPGGIVAFDEYRSPTWPGATRAIDEFFGPRDEKIIKSQAADLYYVVKDL